MHRGPLPAFPGQLTARRVPFSPPPPHHPTPTHRVCGAAHPRQPDRVRGHVWLPRLPGPEHGHHQERRHHRGHGWGRAGQGRAGQGRAGKGSWLPLKQPQAGAGCFRHLPQRVRVRARGCPCLPLPAPHACPSMPPASASAAARRRHSSPASPLPGHPLRQHRMVHPVLCGCPKVPRALDEPGAAAAAGGCVSH